MQMGLLGEQHPGGGQLQARQDLLPEFAQVLRGRGRGRFGNRAARGTLGVGGWFRPGPAAGIAG